MKRRRVLVLGASALAVAAVAAVLVPRPWMTTNDVTTGDASGYPDLQDRVYDFPPDGTVTLAAAVASRIPRWKVVSTDRGARTVHVAIRIALPLFTDDLTIHVEPEGRNARVTIRSRSRVGRSDFGENARHIRALQSAMDARLPRAR